MLRQGWAKQIDEEAVLVVAPGKDQYANFVVQIPADAADATLLHASLLASRRSGNRKYQYDR